MPTPKTIRTFIALPMSPQIHAELGDLQRRLQKLCPYRSIRWVKPEIVHLTLRFLGDILPDRVDPVKEALHVVSRNLQPFDFTVQDLGAFPNLRRPRVVWVGVKDKSGALSLLHQAVNEALESLGFAPEDRPFFPHLTLGRVNRRADRDAVRQIGQVVGQTEVGLLGEVRAAEIIFFRSVLSSSGPEYTPLANLQLGIQ